MGAHAVAVQRYIAELIRTRRLCGRKSVEHLIEPSATSPEHRDVACIIGRGEVV